MTSCNTESNLAKIKLALKKASGSINKTLTILEATEYLECSEVLVQIDSAIGSLNSSRDKVLDYYLDLCINDNLQKGDKVKLKNQLLKLYKLSK